MVTVVGGGVVHVVVERVDGEVVEGVTGVEVGALRRNWSKTKNSFGFQLISTKGIDLKNLFCFLSIFRKVSF